MESSVHFVLQLLVFSIWTQGSDSVYKIKHNKNETAVLGKNATIFCNLTTPEDVLQITWQKIQDSLPQNIGTYSSKHGAKILPPYLDRLYCESIDPKSSFITIREVTFDDEACYKCLFNMFPYGSQGGQICLHIITVSELKVDLQSMPGSEGILNVTCSAVGKPAPQISLFPSQVLVNPPEEHRALNPDGTVTVTKMSNISLEAAASLGVQHVIVHMGHSLRTEDKIVPLPVKDECLSCCTHVWRYVTIALLPMLCGAIFVVAIVYTRQRKEKTKKTEDPTAEQAQPLDPITCKVIKTRLSLTNMY